MIEQPKFVSKNGIEMFVPLGVGIDKFPGVLGGKVFNEGVVEVKWLKNGAEKSYRAPPAISSISPYPMPDMEKIVVLQFRSGGFSDGNAVILNDNGDEICKLTVPQRLSMPGVGFTPKGELKTFLWCNWCQYENQMEFAVSIGDSDFFEFRYFDCKTMIWDDKKFVSARL